jgi:hypothetical protein
VYQNKIYCIGGFDNNGGCSTNEVYDVAADSWSTKASMPRSWGLKESITSGYGSYLQAHVIDGKILVINVESVDVWKPIKDGILQTIKTTAYLYIYDPNTDVWIEKSSTPALFNGDPIYYDGQTHFSDKPFDLLLSVMADDKIILMGIFYKHSISTAENVIIVYDPVNDEWATRESKPPIDFSRTDSRAYAVGVTSGVYAPQRIYIFSQASFYAQGNYVYDPVGDTWSTAKESSVLLNSCGVAMVEDILYIIGQGKVATEFIPHLGYNYEYFSMNEQYVPFGHKDAVPAPKPSVTPEPSNPTTSESIDSSEPTLTYLIITLLIITVGAAGSLILYFNKKKEGLREI